MLDEVAPQHPSPGINMREYAREQCVFVAGPFASLRIRDEQLRVRAVERLHAPRQRLHIRRPIACSMSQQGGARSSSGIEVGGTFEGTVRRLTNYGAFVELPGCNRYGLVHISELAQHFVSRVDALVSVGDRVSVKVLSIDSDNRIALSVRQAQLKGYDRVVQLGGDWGDPWNDEGETRWVKMGSHQSSDRQPWERDPSLTTPFAEDIPKPSSIALER